MSGVSGGSVKMDKFALVDPTSKRSKVQFDMQNVPLGKRYDVYAFQIYDNTTGEHVATANDPDAAAALDNAYNGGDSQTYRDIFGAAEDLQNKGFGDNFRIL